MNGGILWLLADPAKLLDYMLAVFVMTELTKGLADALARKALGYTLPTRGLAWFWSVIVLVVWEVAGTPITAKLLFALLLGSAILCLATFACWDLLAKRFETYFQKLWAEESAPAETDQPRE